MDWKNRPNTQPNCHFRKYSLFNGQQASYIIVKYEQWKSINDVQRAFRREFYPKALCKGPNNLAYTRILKRFKEEIALQQQAPADTEQQRYTDNFKQNPKYHVRQAARVLGLSYGAIWRILRKNLK